MRTIYLDYNATTPIAPVVQAAMRPFLSEHYGNPSSMHPLGRACHEAVEDARRKVSRLLGSTPEEIVFTSGGSEANNLAIKGVAFSRKFAAGGHFVISAIEHPAVAEPANFLQRMGYDVSIVGCDRQGVVDVEDVREHLRPDTVLVSIMHGNNEIGSLQPIRQIADMCRARNVLCHTDAAQTIGKIPTNVDSLGVDLLSIAGHKFYGPKGIGALYVRRSVVLEPLIHGAGHERGMRAGTENVPHIVGLGQAAEWVAAHLEEAGRKYKQLRDRLETRLCDTLGKSVSFNGHPTDRLPNTTSVNFAGVTGGELLRRAPELCASTGAACHSGSAHLSATIAAIGLTPEVARGTLRLSVGWFTKEEDVDWAADALIEAWQGLQ